MVAFDTSFCNEIASVRNFFILTFHNPVIFTAAYTGPVYLV
jgi:hypothetical protein